MKYLFETDQFRFSEDELQLLRSRFPFQKIWFTEISKIEITRGSRTERPVMLFLYGISFIAVSFLFVPFFLDSIWFLVNGYVEGWELGGFLEGLGLGVIMFGMFFGVGVLAIYQAIIPVLILRTEYFDGQHNVFSLKKLQKNGMIPILIEFINRKFRSELVRIDKDAFQ